MVGKGLHIGAVMIGRNEGQWLMACLDSLINRVEHIVYVGSGSSDNSLQDTSAREVVAMFDDDLSRLGYFFGVELSCENYKQTVCSQALSWQQVSGAK